MCLSKLYLEKDGQRALVMEEVSGLEVRQGQVVAKDLFGKEQIFTGQLRQVDLLTHQVIVTPES
ncbi:CooT family nickel-binding protein [Chloroflexota bacterium]